MNIVERIPYAKTGTQRVEAGQYYPAPEKYRDWALPNNGIDLYYAHAKALAQFFGWHRVARQTTDQIDQLFSDQGSRDQKAWLFGQVAQSGDYNSAERDKFLLHCMTSDPGMMGLMSAMGFPQQTAAGFKEMCYEFVTKTCPQAFPKELVSKTYIDRFNTEADEMAKYCCEMNFYMNSIPEYYSLVHPNAQVDNAFYWKDSAGEIRCGLLDWGGVNVGNIPTCLGNGWMGAEPEIMKDHEKALVQLFCDEYEKVSGFKFDVEHMLTCLKLAQAAVFYGCCANIGMCLRIFKRDEWAKMKGRKDPRIDENFLLRCYWVQVYLWMKMWGQTNSPYIYFKKWHDKMGLPKK